MKKQRVYHGLPKTPTNSNTIYYASFDKTNHPEIISGSVESTNIRNTGFPHVTGTGLMPIAELSTLDSRLKDYTNLNMPEVLSFEFWGYHESHKGSYTLRYCTIGFIDIIAVGGSLCIGYWSNRTDTGITLKTGYYHFRGVVRNPRGSVYTFIDLYINGQFKGTYTTQMDKSKEIYCGVCYGTAGGADDYQCSVADVHVCLEDLGDYFPTLPKDFIEGKATVMPRTNQRQVYGDPILQQECSIFVPHAHTNQRDLYELVPHWEDGLFRNKKNPELSVTGGDAWAKGSRISIRGLHTSKITGAYDTDTALAKVVKPQNAPVTKLYLDSVSKLTVNDKIFLAEVGTNGIYDSSELTVTSVNTSENSIGITTCDWNITSDKNYYIYETTTSSSSPVVKTVDGQVVNGTWTNLGRSQAKFTLGDNTGIAQKDLVVTYTITGNFGQSPYTSIPKKVLRGYDDNGCELVPTTELIFHDDLKGKTQGNTDVCPHKVYWQNSASLNEFIGDEIDNASYNLINSQGTYYTYSTMPGQYAMIIAELDVIKLIESKIGHEIPGDKYDWIKKNVAYTRCYAICRGSSGSSNYVNIRYRNKEGVWSLNSGNENTHSSGYFREIHANAGTELMNRDCKTYFAVCSKYNSSVIPSVEVSDFKFEVAFKTDPSYYKYLANPNTFSRTGHTGNPIIIHPQTKTVRRLVPSTKPFVTEIIPHDPNKTEETKDYTYLIEDGFTYTTTYGTGSQCPSYDNVLNGLVGKLGNPYLKPYLLTNDFIIKHAVNGIAYPQARIKRSMSQGYLGSSIFDILTDDIPVGRSLVLMKPKLYNVGNELYLNLYTVQIDSQGKRDNSTISGFNYRLPNRPLIK